MTKTPHGKVPGKTIELDEDPGVAEGQEVEVRLRIIQPKEKWGEGILYRWSVGGRSRMGLHHGADLQRTKRREAMIKVLHGIVHGKTIEVTEDLGMWEGQAVDLLVVPAGSLEPRAEGSQSQTAPKKLPGPPPGWKPGQPSKTAGLLADSWTEEDDRILEQIYRDRKRETRREIPE